MMESIDTFRKTAEECTVFSGSGKTVWMTESLFTQMLDNIEREVEERYIEGPKDKNGVPIHLGDKVCTKLGSTYVVSRITREDFRGTTTWYIEDFASHHSLGPEDLTLCKQPTVEDVLNELCLEYVKAWNGESSKRERREIVAKYTAKLQLREEE